LYIIFLKYKYLISIFFPFVVAGCVSNNITNERIVYSKYKAICVLKSSGLNVKGGNPEIIIINTKKQIKEEVNNLTGTYKYCPGFYCPMLERIYLYKNSNDIVITHEFMHYFLKQSCPELPLKMHHAIIHSLGY